MPVPAFARPPALNPMPALPVPKKSERANARNARAKIPVPGQPAGTNGHEVPRLNVDFFFFKSSQNTNHTIKIIKMSFSKYISLLSVLLLSSQSTVLCLQNDVV